MESMLYPEEQQQQQQQMQQDDSMMIPPSAMNPPMPQNPSDDFFKYRIDNQDILDEVLHQLRGEVPTIGEDGSIEFVQKFKPWANEEGLNKITYLMYSNGINKNTLLGNLSKDEIYYKCKLLKKKMGLLFYRRYSTYGISKEMRTLLVQTVINSIHSSLSRSEGGKEASQLSTAHQRHDIYQHADETKGSGFSLGGLFSRRK